MLDQPASGYALWAISDATGIRPEWLLPGAYLESGYNPAIVNSIGCSGVLQLCQNIPDGYTSWPASQQLSQEVSGRLQATVARYGPLRSGTRFYIANLLPAALPQAKRLGDVIAQKGSSATYPGGGGLMSGAVYAGNSSLDFDHNGTLTVQDIADKVAWAASQPAVQSAIQQTYALRPGQSPMDPVYGLDFPWWTRLDATDYVVAGAGALAAAIGVVAVARPAWLERIVR